MDAATAEKKRVRKQSPSVNATPSDTEDMRLQHPPPHRRPTSIHPAGKHGASWLGGGSPVCSCSIA